MLICFDKSGLIASICPPVINVWSQLKFLHGCLFSNNNYSPWSSKIFSINASGRYQIRFAFFGLWTSELELRAISVMVVDEVEQDSILSKVNSIY